MPRCVVLGWDGIENGMSSEIMQTARSLTAGWSERGRGYRGKWRWRGHLGAHQRARCRALRRRFSPGPRSWTDHRGGAPLTCSPRSPDCHPHRRRRHSRRRCDVQPGRTLAAGHDLQRAFGTPSRRGLMNRAQSQSPRSTGGRESLICTRQFRAASRWQAGAGWRIRIREDASAP